MRSQMLPYNSGRNEFSLYVKNVKEAYTDFLNVHRALLNINKYKIRLFQ